MDPARRRLRNRYGSGLAEQHSNTARDRGASNRLGKRENYALSLGPWTFNRYHRRRSGKIALEVLRTMQEVRTPRVG